MQTPKLSLRVVFGSLVFMLGFWAMTVLWAVLSFTLFMFLPYRYRYLAITRWGWMAVRWLRITCGVTWQVKGRENIPDAAAILVSNHQSTWETLAFEEMFVPQVFVIKKELLMIPFFGWGIRLLYPIAIDRKAKKKALNQLIDQGGDAMDKGRWVIIFPEGTRSAPAERLPFKPGFAFLAIKTARPILPVVHNAGVVWPRGSFWKYPGKVTVSILPSMTPVADEKASTFIARVEILMRAEQDKLSPLVE